MTPGVQQRFSTTRVCLWFDSVLINTCQNGSRPWGPSPPSIKVLERKSFALMEVLKRPFGGRVLSEGQARFLPCLERNSLAVCVHVCFTLSLGRPKKSVATSRDVLLVHKSHLHFKNGAYFSHQALAASLAPMFHSCHHRIPSKPHLWGMRVCFSGFD